MKKILICLLLSFSILFCDGDFGNDSELDIIDIFLVVKQIQKINNKLDVVTSIRENNTTNIKEEFSGIIEKKENFLKQIPNLLIDGKNLNDAANNRLIEEENKIKAKILKNQKAGRQDEVIKDKISLNALEINRIFNYALFKIQNLAKSNGNFKNIKKILEDAKLSIGVIDTEQYVVFTKENMQDANKAKTIEENYKKLKNDKETFLEILEYLHQNIGIFRSSVLFSGLNIKNIINYVNDKIYIKSLNINFGKILIYIAIIAFFWSLRRIIAKLIAFLFSIIPIKITNVDNAKVTILESIVSPISAILFTSGLGLSIQVYYYPMPASETLTNTVFMLYIAFFAWFCISVLEGYGTVLISSVAKKSGDFFRKEVVNLILKILYFIIIIIAALTVLSKIGFDVSALLASLGIGGLAVALAAKDTLANFFASLMLLFDNSFSQGDWIVCGDVEGTVVEIGLRRTTVRTFDNALLFVPNSILANCSIRNWSRRKVGRRIKMQIGLTYNSSKEQIELCVKDIREMLLSHPMIANPNDSSLSVADFRLAFKRDIVSVEDLGGYKKTLLVYLDSFGDSSINILIYCFSKTTVWSEWLEAKEDVMLKIMEIVEKHSLSFAFPSQSLYIESMPKD